MMYQIFLYGFSSFIITLVVIPFFSKIAFFLGIIDIPDGKIKIHKKITPYFGGVSIFFSFLIVAYYANLFKTTHFLINFFGISLLVIVGLIDDIYVMRPLQKLFGQMLATIVFLSAGNFLKASYLPRGIAFLITVLWFLTSMNALNLVDIMDGLAGIISLFASISFFLLAYYLNNYEIMIWSSLLIGGILGFLWYNKPQAKIYLGDAGSLMMGGVLSLLPFNLGRLDRFNDHIFITGVIILAIPLMETFLLIIIRSYKNKPFYLGSPDHSICYLRDKKWNEKKILLFFAFIATCLSLVAQMFFLYKISFFATTSMLCVLLLFSIFIIYGKKCIM